jgi:tetratricopeptide (TPR) repeat protein
LDKPPPQIQESVHHAEKVIAESGRTRNAELLLWTLLYYRYVRADLSIDVERMSHLVSVNARSLRRYFQYALRLLTRRLLHEEWDARTEHRRRSLLAALPCGVPLKLTGRDTQMELAWQTLAAHPPCRIYVTGTAGIGKTSFSEALLQRLINAGRLDHVIWLTSPPSCDYVRRFLVDALLSSQGQLSLRDYMMRYPTALVLDNVDDLLTQPEQVNELLREMSTMTIILTSSVYTALLEVELHLPLSELDETSVSLLIRESPHRGDLIVEEVASWIWEHIGGNPLAVKIAMSLMPFEDPDLIRAQAANETIGRAFERLSEEARICCCALSLLQSTTLSEITSLWQMDTLQDSLSELVRCFFAEHSSGTYRLVTTVATLVRERYATDTWIQGAVNQLLTDMSKHARRAVDVVEQVLFRKWDSLATQLDWMTSFWKIGLEQGHIAQWLAILEAAKADLLPELWMAYGVCLRRAGQWEDAHEALRRASQECGFRGDFSTQIQVMIEWAVLMRLQGDYGNAAAILQQAERGTGITDPAQFKRIQYERSQIALDQGDGNSALQYLQELETTTDVIVSRCEALFLLEEYERCKTAAALALERSLPEPRAEASLYTLIARSHEAIGQIDAAVTYFSLALTILEPTVDISAIARAQANLAASLLKLGKAQQAQRLLERAKPVFTMLEDTVAYHAAMHNQRLVDIFLSRQN